MSQELRQAIERTKALFRERDHALDWSRNLMEGSAGLRTPADWTKYYAFLNNPDNFDPNTEVVPMDIDEEEPDLSPPPEFRVETHVNGNEIVIEYKRKRQDDVDDEKIQ